MPADAAIERSPVLPGLGVWRGHRRRATRLLDAAGISVPRRGPRRQDPDVRGLSGRCGGTGEMWARRVARVRTAPVVRRGVSRTPGGRTDTD